MSKAYESLSGATTRCHRFVWKISGWSNLSVMKNVRSMVFDGPAGRWYINACPDGARPADAGQFGVFLYLVPSNPQTPITAGFAFKVHNQRGGMPKVGETYQHTFTAEASNYGQYQLMPRGDLNNESTGFLLNDTVILELQLAIALDDPPFGKSLSTSQENSALGLDLYSMLGNESLADCTLRTVEHDFKVHKVVLAARSPVFRAMLTSSMQESKNSIVELPEDKLTVDAMIEFMYSDRLTRYSSGLASPVPGATGSILSSGALDFKQSLPPNSTIVQNRGGHVRKTSDKETKAGPCPATSTGGQQPSAKELQLQQQQSSGQTTPPSGLEWENIASLFKAADKYGLNGLTEQCVPLFARCLTVDNVMATLRLATLCSSCAGSPALLKLAKQFAMEHAEKLLLTCASAVDWESALKQRGLPITAAV